MWIYGVIEKGKTGRLALRFRAAEAMSGFANERGLEDTSALGRWKVTGIPVAAGMHVPTYAKYVFTSGIVPHRSLSGRVTPSGHAEPAARGMLH